MSHEIDEAGFEAWLDDYKAAWESRDPSAAADLFTDDASYGEMPFDPPIVGREAIATYWANAVAGQRDVRFTYEILSCGGGEAICHWHCAFTGVPGGAAVELDGIFRCRYADAAHVDRFEEWWHVRAA